MYGFPRIDPRVRFRNNSVTLRATADGTQTSFLFPNRADKRQRVVAYTTTSGIPILIDPALYAPIVAASTVDLLDASGVSVTASFTSPSALWDNNPATETGYVQKTGWFIADLGVSTYIAKSNITLRNSSWPISSYAWYTSTNNSTWTTIASVGAATGLSVYSWPSTILCRYVKWAATGGQYAWSNDTAIVEVELFAPSSENGIISGIRFTTAPAAGSLMFEYIAL